MGSVDRLTRVNELLKREIAGFLERYPATGTALVSITMVKCSVDLRNATVYVSVFGGGDSAASAVLRHMHNCRNEIQHVLARNLAFKHTPVLSFKLDDRMVSGDRVLEILNMEKENDQAD